MAYPIWITPSGSLGILPENQYCEITLDAYNSGGGSLTFYRLAGQLPPGLEIVRTNIIDRVTGLVVFPAGTIKGVPVVSATDRSYQFTVRVQNSTGQIADRTFNLTISNIIPPVIVPEVSDLGSYFDGNFFSLQLVATDPNPSATLVWTLDAGSILPTNLTLSSTGLISGFIYPIASLGPQGATGYNATSYNEFGYDNSAEYRDQTYNFTVRVSDGNLYDTQTYTMNIIAKGNFTADNDIDLINDTYLTVDHDNSYVPIMTTPPQSLPTVRGDSNFAFKFDAIDPNGDTIAFSISTPGQSGFDQNGDNVTHLTGVGFDTTGFDQGGQSLPPGLGIDQNTGWLYGYIPTQAAASTTYEFVVYAYKKDRSQYQSLPVIYNLTVLGDITNSITWLTPSNLGYIDNGAISELAVLARSNAGKDLVYSIVGDISQLPQGLNLLSSGLLVGRTTFEYFTLDRNTTTFDNNTTTYDNTRTFTVEAATTDGTATSTQVFTIRINNFNVKPYENLYLKALPTFDQRQTFLNIVNNTEIFPDSLLYRATDPNFGRAKDVRSLFLPGLNPHQLDDYIASMQTNHFNKRIEFGNVRTAQAVDANFNVKYEVVYIPLLDNEVNDGKSPANEINLTGVIENPYYDAEGNAYTIVYPNSFDNMESVIAGQLGYANQGALPGWMTSPQANKQTLGFTRAIVLAYTVPGASALIAYRLKYNGIEFNSIDFVIDRYDLDDSLSNNYNLDTNSFNPGKETTFDRVFITGDATIHNVNYANSILAFDMINNQTVGHIRGIGGIDGVKVFSDGDLLIFTKQENYSGEANANDGWNLPGGVVVPGYLDHLYNTSVVNERIGIWRINIGTVDMSEYDYPLSSWFGSDTPNEGFDTNPYDEIIDETGYYDDRFLVTLTFVTAVNFNDQVFIQNGTSLSGSTVYYNSTVPNTGTVPTYSLVVSSTTSQSYTTFDNNRTRFINNRDAYSDPETNDNYLKFPKVGVFR